MAKGIGPVKLTRADQKILKSYIPTLQGLAAYLGSSYEIVLHSLEDYDHSVIGIINGEHTGRRIGAPHHRSCSGYAGRALCGRQGLHGVFQPEQKRGTAQIHYHRRARPNMTGSSA